MSLESTTWKKRLKDLGAFSLETIRLKGTEQSAYTRSHKGESAQLFHIVESAQGVSTVQLGYEETSLHSAKMLIDWNRLPMMQKQKNNKSKLLIQMLFHCND